MNPVLMRHIETTNESFKAWRNGKPYLDNPWHYHPEVEITFIIRGCGILFDMAQRGVKVNGAAAKQYIREKMLLLPETTGIERINMLFSILNVIVTCSNVELLSSAGFFSSINERQHHRMNQIYKYVIENFKNPVSVDHIAKELNMTGSSFCRFFKKRAAKSFIQYINEIRVGYACKLLLEENYSVSEIAYESGFENISHFNKQFKKIKNVTPTQFNVLLSKKTN